MREESTRLLVALAAAAASACAPNTSSVAVSVVTDLEPGADFIGVEVEVFSGEARVGHDEAIVGPGDWTQPTPVTDLVGLPRGRARVVVTLYAPGRDVVVTRAVMLELETHHALAMVLASSCVAVHCPGDGDPAEATTCSDGACVAPDCVDCAACASDAECPASDVCGSGRCVEGGCIYPDGVFACPEGEACHPARGCVSASCECDDADPCTVDLCEGTRCIHEPRDGVPCDDGVFCNGGDRCVAGACVNVGPPPCALASCEEDARSCVVGCDDTADCPGDVIGSWGDCVYADACVEAGERTREVTRFECIARRCEPQPAQEIEVCMRSTAGDSCGDDGCSEWTECRFDECATSGAQYRRCWTSRCSGGRCESPDRDETMPCSRGSQEGLTCWASSGFGRCYGTCAAGACGALCAYCDGFCAATGCHRRDGTGMCGAP